MANPFEQYGVTDDEARGIVKMENGDEVLRRTCGCVLMVRPVSSLRPDLVAPLPLTCISPCPAHSIVDEVAEYPSAPLPSTEGMSAPTAYMSTPRPAVDPKKIAEWKVDPPGCDCDPEAGEDCACPAREALPALLAEREEMLTRLKESQTTLRDTYRHLDPSGLSDVPLTMLAKAVRGTHDAALALLREVEWADDGSASCHFCDGHRPGGILEPGLYVNDSTGLRDWRIGHARDCRLAAFLRP